MSTSEVNKTISGRPPVRHRLWWLLPQPFDAVATSLSVGVLALSLRALMMGDPVRSLHLHSWWGPLLLIGATIGLLAIDRLEYHCYGEQTPPRMAVILLVTRFLLTETVVEVTSMDLSPFLYLLLPFRAWLYFGGLAGSSLAALLWIWCMSGHILLHPLWFAGRFDETAAELFTLGMLFSLTMARMVQSERISRLRAEHLSSDLEASNQQLKASAEQLAELAATKERNRLARDIHDSLGHYLTASHVQLEKSLAFYEQEPQVAEQALRAAKRLIGEALGDVRRSVSTLRTTKSRLAFVAELSELVEHNSSLQCKVVLHLSGKEDGFSQLRLLTLYRVAQEGLTNVHKHAQAHHVWIEVCFTEAEARLSLRDDGHGFDPVNNCNEHPHKPGGYGLLGLRERLELVGGSLVIESKPGGGTHLLAIVPRER
jgi:signal transduction histidine kinase